MAKFYDSPLLLTLSMVRHACAPYVRPHDRESHINTVPACGPSGCFVLLYRNPRRRPYGFLIDKIAGGTGLLVAYVLLVPANDVRLCLYRHKVLIEYTVIYLICGSIEDKFCSYMI